MKRIAHLVAVSLLATVFACNPAQQEHDAADGGETVDARDALDDAVPARDRDTDLRDFQQGDAPTHDCSLTGCPAGHYCDLVLGQCRTGCADNAACGENERCDLASHQCVCSGGFHLCDGACVTNDSVDHCGTSCTPCPAPENATPRCDGAQCGLQCDPGYRLCDTLCAPCPAGAGVSQTACSGSACVVTACSLGYFSCPSGCCPWSEQLVITTTTQRFEHLGLVVNGMDIPVITFMEVTVSGATTEGDLSHAWLIPPASPTLSTKFEDKPIVASDLAKSPAGVPAWGVAYQAESVQTYNFWAGIQKSGSHWDQQLNTVSSNVGNWHDLAVDSRATNTICSVATAGNSSGGQVLYGKSCASPGSLVDEEVGQWTSNPEVHLQLDSADAPHVVYRNGGLKYAYRSAGGWASESIGTTRLATWVSLALDSQDNPAVVYVDDQSPTSLRLARRLAGTWSSEVIRTAIAPRPVLRFDSHDNPVVSYETGVDDGGVTKTGLVLSAKDSSGWHHQEIALTSGPHAMDLDSDDRVHLLVADDKNLIYLHN